MTDLPLVFVGGLLGSSHCVGMCGPLALALGLPSKNMWQNLRRQLLFSLGRISTYGFMGASSAFGGLWLSQWSWLAVRIQGFLAIAGGIGLVLLGLTTIGVVPRLRIGWQTTQPCISAGWLKGLLLSGSLLGAFLAGVFTGFIPCGLVYAFLAVAAASGSVVRGWILMTSFGVGTIPLLLLTGCGATTISVAARARILQFAAWCVVIAGAISMARGAGDLHMSQGSRGAACPFCRQTPAADSCP